MSPRFNQKSLRDACEFLRAVRASLSPGRNVSFMRSLLKFRRLDPRDERAIHGYKANMARVLKGHDALYLHFEAIVDQHLASMSAIR